MRSPTIGEILPTFNEMRLISFLSTAGAGEGVGNVMSAGGGCGLQRMRCFGAISCIVGLTIHRRWQ